MYNTCIIFYIKGTKLCETQIVEAYDYENIFAHLNVNLILKNVTSSSRKFD